MNADAYFEIGASHIVCEDYALAGTYKDMGYAVVCDGCSSSPHTDVGARIMAHIARDALMYLHQRGHMDKHPSVSHIRDSFEEIVVKKALEVKSTLRLDLENFDTTLLIAGATPHIQFAMGFGDGVIAVFQEGGSVHITDLEYSQNAPMYLSYEMSLDRRDGYLQTFPGQTITRSEYLARNRDLSDIERFYHFNDLETDWHLLTDLTCRDPIEEDEPDQDQIDEDEFCRRTPKTCIALFSDGVKTYEGWKHGFAEDTKGPLSMEEVLAEGLAYKNPAGQFVERRMRRMARDYSRAGVVHQDDVSCAAIWIGE